MGYKDSLFDKEISPFIQLGIIMILSVVLMYVTTLAPTTPYSKTSGLGPWVILCGLTLFYTVFNAVIGLASKKPNTYYLQSIISYVILLIVGSVFAFYVSGIPLREAGSVRCIFIVLTIGYLVFLSIANLMKFFVQLAQRQDKRLRGEDD